MIHSLSGGILSENKPLDFVKVEIQDDYFSGIFWYITEIKNLKVGDFVLVPFGKQDVLVKAKILRIDKNVSPLSSPVPTKHAKHIFSKIN